MKRFAFRLATLERVRELRLRQARVALAHAVAEAGALRRRRESLDLSIRNASMDPDYRVDSIVLKQWSSWQLARKQQLAALLEDERNATNRVAEHRATHEDRERDLRLLKRLHRRRFETWRREADREETLSLDEVFLSGRASRRSSGSR